MTTEKTTRNSEVSDAWADLDSPHVVTAPRAAAASVTSEQNGATNASAHTPPSAQETEPAPARAASPTPDAEPQTEPPIEAEHVESEEYEDLDEPEKKKSNLKTYILLSAIIVLLIGVISGTLAIKSMNETSNAQIIAAPQSFAPINEQQRPAQSVPQSGSQSPQTPRPSPQTQQAAPVPQAPAPQPQRTQLQPPSTPGAQPRTQTEPLAQIPPIVNAQIAQPAVPPGPQPPVSVTTQSAVPTPAPAPRPEAEVTTITRADLAMFSGKIDAVIALLALDLQESKKRIERLDAVLAQFEINNRELRDREQRNREEFDSKIRELDAKISELREPVEALSAKFLPKKVTTKTESTPSQKQPGPDASASGAPAPGSTTPQAKVASLKSEALTAVNTPQKSEAPPAAQAPKPATPQPTAPAPAARTPPAPAAPTAPAAQAPKPVSSINGFFVVATYPAVGGDIKAQRAWVSNGAKLIEVSIGSKIGDALITGINGTTVVTNEGSIAAKK